MRERGYIVYSVYHYERGEFVIILIQVLMIEKKWILIVKLAQILIIEERREYYKII